MNKTKTENSNAILSVGNPGHGTAKFAASALLYLGIKRYNLEKILCGQKIERCPETLQKVCIETGEINDGKKGDPRKIY